MAYARLEMSNDRAFSMNGANKIFPTLFLLKKNIHGIDVFFVIDSSFAFTIVHGDILFRTAA
jgi:hypothetical protein